MDSSKRRSLFISLVFILKCFAKPFMFFFAEKVQMAVSVFNVILVLALSLVTLGKTNSPTLEILKPGFVQRRK